MKPLNLTLFLYLFISIPLVSMWQEPPKTKRDFSKFPENFVAREQGPSYPVRTLYFYPDGFLLEDEYEIWQVRTGKWTVRNDTIFMTFIKIRGQNGYGELLRPQDGSNSPDTWEFYYNYEMDILEQDFFKMPNIREGQIQKKFADDLDDYIQVWKDFWADIYINIFASDFKKENIFSFPPSGKYTFASIRTLDSLELTKYTRQELRIMRNEIFARYGYVFKSSDLKQYFGSQRWYSPTRENVDKFITDLEKKNIELILKQENAN